jgi:hypothetical protein
MELRQGEQELACSSTSIILHGDCRLGSAHRSILSLACPRLRRSSMPAAPPMEHGLTVKVAVDQAPANRVDLGPGVLPL